RSFVTPLTSARREVRRRTSSTSASGIMITSGNRPSFSPPPTISGQELERCLEDSALLVLVELLESDGLAPQHASAETQHPRQRHSPRRALVALTSRRV